MKQLMVAKKLNMRKIFKKLGFSLMMICHWIKLKLLLLAIIIRYVISKDGKFYPQFFSDDALYELV